MTQKRFNRNLVKKIAEQVAYHCSNCDNVTVGPSEDNSDRILEGEAAHISGLNSGSKRYDESLSIEERNSIENAIWLCRKCHRIFDSDNSFTIAKIKDIRARAIERAKLRFKEGFPEQSLSYVSKNIGDFFEFDNFLGVFMESTSSNNVDSLIEELYKYNSEINYHIINTSIDGIINIESNLGELFLFFDQFFSRILKDQYTQTSFYKAKIEIQENLNQLHQYPTLSEHCSTLIGLQELVQNDQELNFFSSPHQIFGDLFLKYLVDPVKFIIDTILKDFSLGFFSPLVFIVKTELDFSIQIFEVCEKIIDSKAGLFHFIFCVEPINILKFPANVRMFQITEAFHGNSLNPNTDVILNKSTTVYLKRKHKLYAWLMLEPDNAIEKLIGLCASYELDNHFLNVLNFQTDHNFIFEEIESDSTGLRRMPLDVCKSIFTSHLLKDSIKKRISSASFNDPFKISFYNILIKQDYKELDRLIILNCRKEGHLKHILNYVKRLVYILEKKKEIRFRYSVIKSFIKNISDDITQNQFLDSVIGDISFTKNLISDSLYIKGFNFYKNGEVEDAIDCLSKSYDNNEKNISAQCLLAFILSEIEEYDLSIDILNEAISIKNDYEFGYYYKGVIYEKLNDFESAVQNYYMALKYCPNFYECAFNLINCLLELNCYTKALKIADFCRSINQKNFEPFFNIVPVLATNGSLKLAKDILLTLQNFVDEPILTYNHALVDAMLNDKASIKSKLLLLIQNCKNPELKNKANLLYKDIAKLSFTEFRRKNNLTKPKKKKLDNRTKFDDIIKDSEVTLWIKRNSHNYTSISDLILEEEEFKRELQRLNNSTIEKKEKKKKIHSKKTKASRKLSSMDHLREQIIKNKREPKRLSKKLKKELGYRGKYPMISRESYSVFSKVPSYSGG